MIKALADILSQKPQHEIALFLQQDVLVTVPAIGLGVGQMLRPVQFYSQPGRRAEKGHFHLAARVEGYGQYCVEAKFPGRLRQRLQASKEKGLSRAARAIFSLCVRLPGPRCVNKKVAQMKSKTPVIERHVTTRTLVQYHRMVELVKRVEAMIAAEHFLPNEQGV